MVSANIDHLTVAGFGDEWAAHPQTALPAHERQNLFNAYFALFPFDSLPSNAEGFDLGCGSGRWAAVVSPRVGTLHCIDPARKALDVARRNAPKAKFHLADADSIPLPDESQDFGYSLGVLHHIPDTQRALDQCVRKLKRGAPFLLYVYYAFDNRPAWYRAVWKASDVLRRAICRLPFRIRRAVCEVIAILVYWPLSRASRLFGQNFPLWSYRDFGLVTLRTDALDRFGTRLEQRFTKDQVREMMERSGLTNIRFASLPYWTAIGVKG